MQLTSSQEYANFRAWVPRNIVSVGVQHPQSWLYYDWGPRSYPEPLLCLHALIGSPESFFHQIISLAPRGYRVISVHIAAYWTVSEYCDALHSFLDMLDLGRIHIYAAGLGALLATRYALRKPDRIASLILTHALLSLPYTPPPPPQRAPTSGTTTASNNIASSPSSATTNTISTDTDQQHSSMPPTPTFVTSVVPYSPAILRWLPPFLVRSAMRALLPSGRTSTEQAQAAEFLITQTMSESRDVLAARLALVVTASKQASASAKPPAPFFFSPRRRTDTSKTSQSVSVVPNPNVVTLIDTLDRTQSALALSDHVATNLRTARRAFLKEGGDFPYLSAPDDVNVHLVVHLRRHAPVPSGPMPTPPPAKRRPLPSNLTVTPPSPHRQHSADAVQQSDNNQLHSPIPSTSDPLDADESQLRLTEHSATSHTSTGSTINRKVPRSRDELAHEARAIVAADERDAIEQYAYEINRLREFFPGRDDSDLCIIMQDCGGAFDIAVERALSHSYEDDEDGDDFFSRWRAQAIDRAMADLLREEEQQYTEPLDDDLLNTNDDSKKLDPSDPLGGSSTPNPSSSLTTTPTKLLSSPNGEDSLLQQNDNDSIHIDGRGDAVDIVGPAEYSLTDVHTQNEASSSALSTPTTSAVRRTRYGGSSPAFVSRGPTPFPSGIQTVDANDEDVEEDADEGLDDTLVSGDAGLLEGVTASDPLAGADAVVTGDKVKEKQETFISWKGVLPQNEDDEGLDVDYRGDSLGGADGWEQFRRKQVLLDLDDKGSGSINVGGEDGNGTQNGAVDEQANATAAPTVSESEESEEDRRLRLWSMSAVTAASNVNNR